MVSPLRKAISSCISLVHLGIGEMTVFGTSTLKGKCSAFDDLSNVLVPSGLMHFTLCGIKHIIVTLHTAASFET